MKKWIVWALAVFNILLSFWLGFWCVATQLGLIAFGILGLDLFFCGGILLFTLDENIRRAVVFSVFPLGLFAVHNALNFGISEIQSYFHTSLSGRIVTAVYPVLAIVLNLIVLNLPAVKGLFSKTIKW